MTDKEVLMELHKKITDIPIPYDSRDVSDIVLGESIMRNAILHIVSEYLQRNDNDTELIGAITFLFLLMGMGVISLLIMWVTK